MLSKLNNALFSPLAIAPMIDWTYTHFRVLMRLLAPHALLYTEMQTPNAIKHQPERALLYHETETPLALQLGGSDPKALATAAMKAEALGFSEVNLNLGCPSPRVQKGAFGAVLMSEPRQVADCIHAMKAAVSIPVTAKTRIGIDHDDSYEFFKNFVATLIDAGADKLIVHARKAWLNGLSPKQNRSIPPLHYDYVHKIKSELPAHIPVVINGQVETIPAIKTHLKILDGVMIGRLACRDPYAIANIHHACYPNIPKPTRSTIFKAYSEYAAQQKTAPMHLLLKPILNLVHGLPSARTFKHSLLTLKSFDDVVLIEDLTEKLQALDGFSLSTLVN